MASLIDLKTFTDKRGNLTVIEKVVPFDVKRIFYIYGVDSSVRGGAQAPRYYTSCNMHTGQLPHK